MKTGDDEYKKKLWEYFASKGGNPEQTGAAIQGWYIAREKEFAKLLKEAGELEDEGYDWDYKDEG